MLRPARAGRQAERALGARVSIGFYRGTHSKYNAIPTRCNQGQFHHSKLEANRCDELHVLQAGGILSELKAHPQPAYPLVVNGHKLCSYVADFEYVDADGNVVTEDTKGFRTEVYKLKAELFLALYGREVREVTRTRGRR